MPKENTSQVAKRRGRPRKQPLVEQHKHKLTKTLQDISSGSNTLQACKDNGISSKIFYTLLAEAKELRSAYARAREGQAGAYADKLLVLADDVVNGRIDPQAARTAGDLIKWTASRILPHTYGDKVEISIDRKQSLADYALEHAKRVQVIEVD